MSTASPPDRQPPEPAATSLGGRFWAFWSAALAANLSDGVAMIALPWLAASLTDDPVLVAAVATAGRLPWLILTLPIGVLLDRLARIRVMIATGGARAVLWAGLALAIVADQASVPLVVTFAFCFGALEVCYDTAAETVVPGLVPHQRLERANGHLRTAALVAQEFGGRPIGGLVLTLGMVAPFVLNIAALTISVLALARLREPPRSRVREPGEPLRRMGRDLTEGVRTVWRHPLLRLIAGIAIVVNGSYATAVSTQVLFVQDVLGLGSIGFGVLMAVAAVGGVLGAQSVARLRGWLPRGTLPVVSLAMASVAYGVVAAVPAAPVVAVGYLAASGFVVGYSIAVVSVRQRVTPDHLLGRVNAAMRTVSWGISAVGMAAGGVIVSALTPVTGYEAALRAPYLLIAVVGVGVVACCGRRLTGLMREHDR